MRHFGGVPLRIEGIVDYSSDLNIQRSSEEEIYNQIISDLNFFAFFESLKDFAELRNLSIPPLKSTVLKAELDTFNLIFFFNLTFILHFSTRI